MLVVMGLWLGGVGIIALSLESLGVTAALFGCAALLIWMGS